VVAGGQSGEWIYEPEWRSYKMAPPSQTLVTCIAKKEEVARFFPDVDPEVISANIPLI
jgi:hypothetical protein